MVVKLMDPVFILAFAGSKEQGHCQMILLVSSPTAMESKNQTLLMKSYCYILLRQLFPTRWYCDSQKNAGCKCSELCAFQVILLPIQHAPGESIDSSCF